MTDMVAALETAHILGIDEVELARWHRAGRMNRIDSIENEDGTFSYSESQVIEAASNPQSLTPSLSAVVGSVETTVVPDRTNPAQLVNGIIHTNWLDTSGTQPGIIRLDIDASDEGAIDDLYHLIGRSRRGAQPAAITQELTDMLNTRLLGIATHIKPGPHGNTIIIGWQSHATRRLIASLIARPDRADGRLNAMRFIDESGSYAYSEAIKQRIDSSRADDERRDLQKIESAKWRAEEAQKRIQEQPLLEQLADKPGWCEHLVWADQGLYSMIQTVEKVARMREEGWDVHDLGVDDSCTLLCYRKHVPNLASAIAAHSASDVDKDFTYLPDDADKQMAIRIEGPSIADAHLEERESALKSYGYA